MSTTIAGELEASGPRTPMGVPEPDSGDEEVQNGSEVPVESNGLYMPVSTDSQGQTSSADTAQQQQQTEEMTDVSAEVKIEVENQQTNIIQPDSNTSMELLANKQEMLVFDLNTFIGEARKNSEDQFTAFKQKFIYDHDMALKRANNDSVALEFIMDEAEVCNLIERFRAGLLLINNGFFT